MFRGLLIVVLCKILNERILKTENNVDKFCEFSSKTNCDCEA